MQTAAPGLPALVTTTIQAAQANGLLPNILVPVINELDDVSGSYAGDQRPAYDAFVKNGGTLWTYQSCMSHGCAFGGDPSQSGWPSYMIDASGGRNRAMQWVDFNERVTGELYYETVNAYEGGDPWADQYRFGGNGDGTLFYPGEPSKIGGQTEIPVASLRLKLIRQGMEDYEYLAKVSALGDPAFAAAQAATVAKDPHSVSSDPQLFHAARAALGARILQLMGAALPTADPAPAPEAATSDGGSPGPSSSVRPLAERGKATLGAFSRCAGATDDPRCTGAFGEPVPRAEPGSDGQPDGARGVGCQTGAGSLSLWASLGALLLLFASKRRRLRLPVHEASNVAVR